MAITITPAAESRIIDILQADGYYVLRFGIEGGGCNGMQYFIRLCANDLVTDTDTYINLQGPYHIVIDEISMQYMDGTEIDFTDDKFNSHFIFNNPLVSSSCGCNKSVGFS